MRARYAVVELLGTRVCRGVAESTNGSRRDVVIERVLPELTNQTYVEMLLGDLRPCLHLQHANIVEVLDIARTPANAYCVVTEYVDGCDLNALVTRRGRVALPHVLHVVMECCKALSYAHAHDIIHRDVSPRAVRLSTRGEVKLDDFGLAKINTQTVSSEAGVVKGRFGYLSPELAAGLPVDARTDVFALGIVLWELLAGRGLFVGDTDYETVTRVREARVASIDGLDPVLDAVVRRALAKDVRERYQHASDLADALASYAVSHGIAISPRGMGKLVGDVQLEIRRERASARSDPQIERVQADVRRMISIVHPGWN